MSWWPKTFCGQNHVFLEAELPLAVQGGFGICQLGMLVWWFLRSYMVFVAVLVWARQSNSAVALPAKAIPAFLVFYFYLLDPLGAGSADRVAHQVVAARNYAFPDPLVVTFTRVDQLFQLRSGILLIIFMEETILRLISCHRVLNIIIRRRWVEWSIWLLASAGWAGRWPP